MKILFHFRKANLQNICQCLNQSKGENCILAHRLLSLFYLSLDFPCPRCSAVSLAPEVLRRDLPRTTAPEDLYNFVLETLRHRLWLIEGGEILAQTAATTRRRKVHQSIPLPYNKANSIKKQLYDAICSYYI